MQSRPVVLATISVALVMAAPGAFAQGKGGKSRLVICHAPPGNPDARRTMEIPEAAWAGHEAHGDTLGPCDGHAERHPREYGSDDERAKRTDERKRRDRDTSDEPDGDGGISDEPDRERRRDRDISDEPDDDGGISDEPDRDRRRDRQREISTESEGDAAEDTGSEGGEVDRTRERRRIDRPDADAGAEAGEDSDASEARRARRATRRDSEARDQPAAAADGSAADESRSADEAGATDGASDTERGFFRGIQRFFGFGGDEADE